MDMGAVGGLDGGGCRRLALTDEDRRGRDLFVRWARDAGCRVQIDGFGNIFAVRDGVEPDLPMVVLGSHLDTQPHGGLFDGILGVLAGLEVVRALNDAELATRRSIAVATWTNEEGTRFGSSLTGSKGFAGQLRSEEADRLTATDGSTFGAELDRIGYRGPCRLGPESVGCYLELHIEQGPILDQRGAPVGIVAGAQGARWFEVSITGRDGHAGATPHEMRADSFMAAARFATDMRAACLAADADSRFTIGRVDVEPGAVNTIPGHTTLSVDLRHPDGRLLDQLEDDVHGTLARIDGDEGTRSNARCTARVEPVAFDAGLVELLRGLAGPEAPIMTSGALHDACAIAAVAPTAMVFIPCRGGLSHNEAEWAEPEYVVQGAVLLGVAALRCANGP